MAVTTTALLTAPLAIQAIVLPAVLVLGILAASKVKPQGDRARRGFLWFHTSLWLFFLTFLLSLVSYATRLAYYQGSAFIPSPESQRRLSSVVSLFVILSNAALLVCISELAAGAKLASKQMGSKGFRIFVFIFGAVVSLLELISFGYQQHQITARQAFLHGGSSITERALALLGDIAVLLLIAGSLIIFIFALIQRHATHKYAGGEYAPAGNLIAGIAGLYSLLLIWSLISALVVAFSYNTVDLGGWTIADIVIDRCGTLVILLFIYVLGRKQVGGLWLILGTNSQTKERAIDPVSRV